MGIGKSADWGAAEAWGMEVFLSDNRILIFPD
jgi:hypothetical protein